MIEIKLTYYGNPILRKKAKPVKDFNQDLKDLANAMIKHIVDTGTSVGIAAPQVGHSVRLFITQAPNYDEDKNEWIDGEICVYVNPEIVKKSDEIWDFDEGCLSIPEVYGKVTRFWAITVVYQDLEGKKHTKDLKGYEARVFQHEFDHINGILFVDRIMGKARQVLESQLKEIKEKYKNS